MNCGWCNANCDGSDSHGICSDCAEKMKLQHAIIRFERVPSYVEVQAGLFAQECEEALNEETVLT